MSSNEQLRVKRLRRVHERFLEASERWPEARHAAIHIDWLETKCEKKIRRTESDGTTKYIIWLDDQNLHEEVYSQASNAVGFYVNHRSYHHWELLKFDNTVWYGRYCPASSSCDELSLLHDASCHFSQLAEEVRYAIDTHGCFKWLDLIYAIHAEFRHSIPAKQPNTEIEMRVAWLTPNVFSVSANALELLEEHNWSIEACVNRRDDGCSVVTCNESDSPNEKETRLNDAERDILSVIQEAKQRLTTPKVLAALEAKNGAVAESTTKSTLATLVRRGLLTNRSDTTPKGYGLPEWK